MLVEIRRIFSRTCVCFTVCEFVLLIVAQAVMSAEGKSDTLVSFLGLKPAVLILTASLVFNLLSYILKIKALPGVAKRLLHYLASMLCVIIICVVIPQRAQARFLLVLIFLATLLYLVIWLAAFLLGRIFVRKSDDGGYVSVFDEKKID